VFNTTITYHEFTYPEWSIVLGWSSCGASMICIPLYIGYKLLYKVEGDCIERIQSALRPDKEWGPAVEFHRKEWLNIVNYEKAQKLRRKLSDNKTEVYHEQFVSLSSANVDA